ncbi:hypothetical protein NV379_06120 [Paenibacillus sp. N1-5-1-14]|uniref:hypothetical protein n=1 Tax=Paenibacillus radicibacter TaxID=2972488 RepID=UPI002158E0B7|nr:hypothetical protein [Paenibacillus radicibacter]MCR8642232.1 hypothetical protein [Paenibacillus radicibacter]
MLRNPKVLLPFLTTLLLVVALSITAIFLTKSTSFTTNKLYVEPQKLFTGELSKYAALVDGTYGALKVKYKGSKQEIGVKMETYKNGVLTDTNALAGGLFIQDSRNGEYQFDGDYVIWIRELKNSDTGNVNFQLKHSFTENRSISSVQMTLDTDFKTAGRMNIEMNTPAQITDHEEIAVWGFQATDENQMRTTDFSPEYLKNTKYAVVFKLYLH